MSSFTRLLHPLPAVRRSYSSFFSSKPGGGRYFNSSKPPKSVVTTGATAASKKAVAVGTQSSAGQGEDANGSSNAANITNSSETEGASSPSSDTGAPAHTLGSSSSHNFRTSLSHLSHPMVNSKDFKLHQFFSLHRPLLLIADPPSILQTAPLTGPLYSSPTWASSSTSEEDYTHAHTAPNPSDDQGIDADAEAARQLTRALMMNRAGGVVDWENTLRRLGLDVEEEAERVGSKVQMEKEWQDVLMDSTKRKRRKKMKKHKLKKRRRATRSQRLKLR